MLMFCNVGLLVFSYCVLKLMLTAFIGHRFDEDTPIAETVRGSTSEAGGVIG